MPSSENVSDTQHASNSFDNTDAYADCLLLLSLSLIVYGQSSVRHFLVDVTSWLILRRQVSTEPGWAAGRCAPVSFRMSITLFLIPNPILFYPNYKLRLYCPLSSLGVIFFLCHSSLPPQTYESGAQIMLRRLQPTV